MKPQAKLSQPQRRHLKALAHHLHPVVMTGQAGMSEAVLAEINLALEFHELIKIKVSAGDRTLREEMIQLATKSCQAELIDRIGNMAILFRRNTKKPKVALPSA